MNNAANTLNSGQLLQRLGVVQLPFPALVNIIENYSPNSYNLILSWSVQIDATGEVLAKKFETFAEALASAHELSRRLSA
jgi:hypothetical protein